MTVLARRVAAHSSALLEDWGPLFGVALGWFLAVGWQSLRDWRRRRRLKDALKAEIESLLGQIPQFIDITDKTIAALAKHEILAGPHVPAVTSFFESLFSEIAPQLNRAERNLLHVVHGRLRVADEVFATFDIRLRQDLKEGIIEDPWSAYQLRFRDLQESYDVCTELLLSYLEGDPTDPFPQTAGE